MTLSLHDRDMVWRKLDTRVLPRLVAIRENAETGLGADYNREVWTAVLDWIEGPLAKKLLYDPRIPADQRGEKSPLYAKFEVFNRGRLQGVLEDPKLVGSWFCLLRDLLELQDDALRFFKVRFRDYTSLPDDLTETVLLETDAP